MTVLVTGASGFVGSLLVPRLQDAGATVRAAGRSTDRIEDALMRSRGARMLGGVTLHELDALTGTGLEPALEGVEVAYYLIHSMEPTRDAATSFAERDRRAAENFAAAARRAGVARIVYLGGHEPRGGGGGRVSSPGAAGGRAPRRGRRSTERHAFTSHVTSQAASRSSGSSKPRCRAAWHCVHRS
jgi:nucleoside-diphosphate-sugar epimerase